MLCGRTEAFMLLSSTVAMTASKKTLLFVGSVVGVAVLALAGFVEMFHFSAWSRL